MGVEVGRRGGERKEGGVIQEDEHIFGLKADLLQCSKLSQLIETRTPPLPRSSHFNVDTNQLNYACGLLASTYTIRYLNIHNCPT